MGSRGVEANLGIVVGSRMVLVVVVAVVVSVRLAIDVPVVMPVVVEEVIRAVNRGEGCLVRLEGEVPRHPHEAKQGQAQEQSQANATQVECSGAVHVFGC